VGDGAAKVEEGPLEDAAVPDHVDEPLLLDHEQA